MRLRPGPFAILILALALVASGAVLAAQGDGSGTSNPLLSPDAYRACAEQGLCGGPPELRPPAERQEVLDVDWSVAFNVAYRDCDCLPGSPLSFRAVPTVSFDHQHVRGATTGSATAELSYVPDGAARIGAVRFSTATEYALTQTATLIAGASLTFSQADPDALGTDPNIASTPLVVGGGGSIGLAQQLGRLALSATLDAARTVTGDTVLVDSAVIDNSFQNSTSGGLTLRAAYDLTPVLTPFAEIGATYEAFDAASPDVGAYLDGWTYTARTGIAVSWGGQIDASASIGYGLKDFDDVVVSDVGAWLVDAALTYRHDDATTVNATFGTSFEAVDCCAAAKVTYAAGIDASYAATSVLTLRGAIDGSYSVLPGTSDSAWDASAGIGADYLINRQWTVSADYLYSRNQDGADPLENEHRVTLGMVVRR